MELGYSPSGDSPWKWLLAIRGRDLLGQAKFRAFPFQQPRHGNRIPAKSPFQVEKSALVFDGRYYNIAINEAVLVDEIRVFV